MTDVYQVQVWKLVPGTTQWTKELQRSTSAQSPLGSLKSVLDTETQIEMLKNQQEIDAEPTDVAPGGEWAKHPNHADNVRHSSPKAETERAVHRYLKGNASD